MSLPFVRCSIQTKASLFSCIHAFTGKAARAAGVTCTKAVVLMLPRIITGNAMTSGTQRVVVAVE